MAENFADCGDWGVEPDEHRRTRVSQHVNSRVPNSCRFGCRGEPGLAEKVAVEGSSFGSREKEVLFIYRLTSLKRRGLGMSISPEDNQEGRGWDTLLRETELLNYGK